MFTAISLQFLVNSTHYLTYKRKENRQAGRQTGRQAIFVAVSIMGVPNDKETENKMFI